MVFLSLECVASTETVKLAGIAGTEVQAEEKPDGEILVASGGEALRPPGMNTKISFLSFSWGIWAVVVVICFTLGASLATR